MNNADINTLIGMTMSSVKQVGSDELIFTNVDGRVFKFFHSQSCCESVEIESIVGDLQDLVRSPILLAEEAIKKNENPEGFEPTVYQDCFTWTFYKFATIKGYVDVRWYGGSNGYYSERVEFVEVVNGSDCAN